MRTGEEISEKEAEPLIKWAKAALGEPVSVSQEAHGDEGIVYKLVGTTTYFLKMRKGPGFVKERERLEWFAGRLPVPGVIASVELKGMSAMLLTALPGKNLAALCKEWPVEKVIVNLARVLREFHALNTSDWPFDSLEAGKVLVHGDACLPNFIFDGDSFSGYIDLGASRLAGVEVDLAAAVWSLQYNMGPGHGPGFLKEYCYPDTSEEMTEKLRLQYESWQEEQGFL